MSETFCTQCGNVIAQNARFCNRCGAQKEEPNGNHQQNAAQSNSSANTDQTWQAHQTGSTQAQYTRRSPAVQIGTPSRSSFFMTKVVLPLVGLMLLILAIQGPLLMIAGESAIATVTDVRRSTSSNTDRLEYNYNVYYAFTISGERYGGHYTLNNVLDVSKLPRKGHTFRISYWPVYPNINMRQQGAGIIGLQTLVFGALGLFLLAIPFMTRRRA